MPPMTRVRLPRAAAQVTSDASSMASPKVHKAASAPLAKSPKKAPLVIPQAVAEDESSRKRRKVAPKEPKPTPIPRSPIDLESAIYEPSKLPVEPQFNVQDAMNHLTSFDPRFRGLFDAMKCRPFVEPFEALDPYRTLTTSIVGQQVSWMAARAINNRFRGLFGYKEDDEEGFPSPADVVKKDVLVLKSAGLSMRKAEYVKSLAEHFLRGELSTELLRHGTDEEITKALIAVRGIGQWTVDMFLIFSLRRPNILPYGDLGVQKGLLRFALTAHNAFPDAKGKFQLKKKDKVAQKTPKSGDTDDDKTRATPPPQANMALPPTPLTPSNTGVKRGGLHTPNAPGGSTTAIWPPTPLSPGTAPQEMLVVPKTEVPSATPDSAEDLLEPVGGEDWEPHRVAPLGAGLTIETMRSRWAGKKVKGGAYLTPAEMDVLTEGWAPYRSLGVYYTWAIADGGTA